MTERTFDKLTIYSETGTDPAYALRALTSSILYPESKHIGFSYGEPRHTSVSLKRNKAGVTVWVYKP